MDLSHRERKTKSRSNEKLFDTRVCRIFWEAYSPWWRKTEQRIFLAPHEEMKTISALYPWHCSAHTPPGHYWWSWYWGADCPGPWTEEEKKPPAKIHKEKNQNFRHTNPSQSWYCEVDCLEWWTQRKWRYPTKHPQKLREVIYIISAMRKCA